MRALWNRAAIGWAGRFIRDHSGPFMDIIAVRPVSASTLFRGERETNLHAGGLQNPPLLARCVHNRPRRLGLESDGIRRASHGSEVARKWAR